MVLYVRWSGRWYEKLYFPVEYVLNTANEVSYASTFLCSIHDNCTIYTLDRSTLRMKII